MNIRETIEHNGYILAGGAMGSYCSLLKGAQLEHVEELSLTDPETVREVHRSYLEAGARLINSNTFGANSFNLDMSRPELCGLIARAWELASGEAEKFGAFVAADIGPLPEMVEGREVTREEALEEFRFLIDCFLEQGADIFNFETFSTTAFIGDLAAYIRGRNPSAFIMGSFSVSSSGTTLLGYPVQRIFRELEHDPNVDVVGLNCGTGPTHLVENLAAADFHGKWVSLVPNASYPELVDGKIVYSQNPEYFADYMLKARDMGVRILGGCCGTTPDHIRLMASRLAGSRTEPVAGKPDGRPAGRILPEGQVHPLEEKLSRGEFVVAVELPPPRTPDVEDTGKMAARIREAGADIITFSDSPLGRVRTNPIALSARIQREVGVETLPHLCCRDRNVIALKSDLMGAYIENLHNVLLVTGDPIPMGERGEISSIFNLNSFKLIELVNNMNQDVFASSPFFIGAALDLNGPRKDKALARMERKASLGARFFMTQPIFDREVLEYLRKEKLKESYTILAGIMPVVNLRNARFLHNEIPGISIPDEVFSRFREDMSREEAEETGVQLALETIRELKELVSGIYLITPLNRVATVERIIREIR